MSVRLDKWLFAARFYRTRSIAAAAVDAGKIEIDGQRPKPSRAIKVGDRVTIRRSIYEQVVLVLVVSDKRGPAKVAETLYRETEESIVARVERTEKAKSDRLAAPTFDGRGRPTKKDRRDLFKFRRFPPRDE